MNRRLNKDILSLANKVYVCQNMSAFASVPTRMCVGTHTHPPTHTHTHTHNKCRVVVLYMFTAVLCHRQPPSSVKMILLGRTNARRSVQVTWSAIDAQVYVGAPVLSHAHLTCIYNACEGMIAKSMNLGNVIYHMHLVRYVGILIRSSFGGIGVHI
jgi:hypothetical protein